MRSKLIGAALFGLVVVGAGASLAVPQVPRPASPVVAAQPSPALRMRADQVVELFNGARALKDYFIPDIPVEQFNRNLTGIRNEFGAALRVSALEANAPNSGVVTVDFERGQRRLRIRVADEPPHLVNDFGPPR